MVGLLHLATAREEKADGRLFPRQTFMMFAVFTAKTAAFSRRMNFDGVLHLAFMHLQHPPFSIFNLQSRCHDCLDGVHAVFRLVKDD